MKRWIKSGATGGLWLGALWGVVFREPLVILLFAAGGAAFGCLGGAFMGWASSRIRSRYARAALSVASGALIGWAFSAWPLGGFHLLLSLTGAVAGGIAAALAE
jgi:hypothetical protein